MKNEFDLVFKKLREDKELYYGWQSNIAMPFLDGCREAKIYNKKLYGIANNAAKQFLDLLIKEN